MSDGPDGHHDQHRDELHDDELSRRYRALPTELPHPDTDALIQAAARQALMGTKRQPRSAAFYGGLAMAASVTLVMAILLPSWRTGQLHDEVAVHAPAEAVVVPAVMDEAVESAALPAPTRPAVAITAVPMQAPQTQATKLQTPRLQSAQTQIAKAQLAKTGAPPMRATMAHPVTASPAPAEAAIAFDMPLPKAVVSAPAVTSAAPALLPEPVRPAGAVSSIAVPVWIEADAKQEAAAVSAPASAEREVRADRVREEAVSRQKARMAMAPAPVLKKVLATDDLLLAGRYAEALTALQTGAVATDSSFDSRRDLLRQLLPGEAKPLQCQAGTGPGSAQALCRWLQQYQAVQQGRAERSVLAAAQEALQQALQAEGRDPAPLLQAIADLPSGP